MPKLRYAVAMAFFVMASGVLATAAQAAPDKQSGAYEVYKAKVRKLSIPIKENQAVTWNLQRLMGQRPTPTSGRNLYAMSLPAVKKAVRRWRWHAIKALKAAHNVPHRSQWLCIFSYENNKDRRKGPTGWKSNIGNGYYGGLQMDRRFMETYGGFLLRMKGTADHWTPDEQMWIAERAYESGRGFHPWPNTAHDCGLI